MENRQGEDKNSVGNVEAKELISMTHGHEHGRGWVEWSGVKGGKWDNCNSIINKYIKKIVATKTMKKLLHNLIFRVFNGSYTDTSSM